MRDRKNLHTNLLFDQYHIAKRHGLTAMSFALRSKDDQCNSSILECREMDQEMC